MDSHHWTPWSCAGCARTDSRRRMGAALLGALALLGVPALDDGATDARKKRKKKKKRCPADQIRCPKGFPSACCAAGSECCDTSRLGCCEVE